MSKLKDKYAVDRFIPHRAGENFDSFYYNLTTDIFDMNDIWPSDSPAHRNYAQKFFKRRSYLEGLWKLLVPKPRKVLNFTLNGRNNCENEDESEDTWSVIMRKRPLIAHPLLILDLPEVDTNLCYNSVDWSKTDHIAAVCDGDIFIWCDENSKSKSIFRSKQERVRHCLKFNCDGTLLAVALRHSRILILKPSTNEVVTKEECCSRRSCAVTSFAWSKSHVLVSGCTNGKVCSRYIDKCAVIRGAHEGAVIAIRFSCNENYLATSGLDGTVQIRKWPQLDHMFSICNFLPVKAFTWHPWQESLLVCCVGKRNSNISLWNVCNHKKVYLKKSNPNLSIDAMTFNSRSGELVVALHNASAGRTFIAVLPNVNTICDGIIWHVGRVPYLLWNGDSTKLLTAGSDEYICIWSFFGESSSERIPEPRKVSSASSHFGCFNFFQSCIR